MNDRQVDMLIAAAQKAFVSELAGKISEMEVLFDVSKAECSKIDLNSILRFFHSINGTASTLGLDYISSIGKEWEDKIRALIQQGCDLDHNILQGAKAAINDIKQKVNNLSENCDTRSNVAESSEYVNMPDRGKILLVDDDISILKLLENSFTMEGYKVYICDDSVSAMDIVAVSRPDIIILDVMMPGLNGYELLERIKSRPEYLETYVIFLSSRSDVDERIKGLKCGADEYIAKPFVIGELITRVEMVMRRSNSYREKLLKDSLTDAYSRYYFNLRIAEELERYKRYGSIFSIAFIDMDHYKYVNDNYGHQTGDFILKYLVSHISENIRKCDSLYRYGGEEFIILLPDTAEEKAYMVIDRLRHVFSCKPISIGGESLHITFSAGIKQVSDENESLDEIVNHADKAMYYAKRSGRNKVVIYNDSINLESIKKTLLIVDDENTILRLLKDRFSNIGYNVITAKDGESAIALAERTHPDAIVLDLILPDIDGFEVCTRLKMNMTTHSSKIIMLSKKKQKESIVKGLRYGADDYLTKPFSMAELEARIVKALNSTH